MGLSWTAVLSCKVCSLVSISKATVPICISPHFSPPFAPLAAWARGLLLTTQQATKKAAAISKRRGPMTMVTFPAGTKVPKASAPTRVTLMPASMMHRPQAQQREGEGRFWWKEGGAEVMRNPDGAVVRSGFHMWDTESCVTIR